MHSSTHVPFIYPHHTYTHLAINLSLYPTICPCGHPSSPTHPIYLHHKHHPICSSIIYLPTHPAFTSWFAHLTHLPTHTTIYPPTLLPIPHTHPSTPPPIYHPLTHLSAYLPNYLHTRLLICSPLTHSQPIFPPSIYPPIHLFTHHPSMYAVVPAIYSVIYDT